VISTKNRRPASLSDLETYGKKTRFSQVSSALSSNRTTIPVPKHLEKLPKHGLFFLLRAPKSNQSADSFYFEAKTICAALP